MGLVVLEHQQQPAAALARFEDSCGDKDKKKKRRSNRRGKQSVSPSGAACNSMSEQLGEAPQCFQGASTSGQYELNKESNKGFVYLSALHRDVQGRKPDVNVNRAPKSCSVPVPSRELIRFHGEDFIPPYTTPGCNQQKCFNSHLSPEDVRVALKKGEVFKATFRVNAYNRVEAYCTIDGFPVDVLLNGISLQNRAIEGDVVAIKVDDPTLWIRMKGSSNPEPSEDHNRISEASETVNNIKGKGKLDTNCGYTYEKEYTAAVDDSSSDKVVISECVGRVSTSQIDNYVPSSSLGDKNCTCEEDEVIHAVERLCEAITAFPSKRPTGRVVAIIEPSPRRDSVVGFLDIKQCLSCRERSGKDNRRNKKSVLSSRDEYIYLSPTDPRFPKMIVPVEGLPEHIKRRLDEGDVTIETVLVGAKIEEWKENSLFPFVCLLHIFGHAGEMDPHIEAILFENKVCCSEFSPEALSSIPQDPWNVPQTELENRKDIRNLCVFSIDPSTASDLDDALSVERLSDEVYRVGVHIADISFFVQPDAALDMEAQVRSTSVYTLQSKFPMLPAMLSENIISLIPGVDRLGFSIFWDISKSGEVLDRWIGRTVLHSCCKLSYENAQGLIAEQISFESSNPEEAGFPQVYGNFSWQDIITSVRCLYEISKALKVKRLNDGALVLENSKVVFFLDVDGIPCDSKLNERKASNILVEEFMLLANRTAAEVISRAYPECALLRRHPEPNVRKLRDLQTFFGKHGLELDTSTSRSFNRSLREIKVKLKDDSVLYDILILYATKPMQLAKYFCSGDENVSENEWKHYALAVPLYTHFTSPLRRYPDIVVHRTLAAVLEAEEIYSKQGEKNSSSSARCFTGIYFEECSAESDEAQEVLSAAAAKHGVLCTEMLSYLADHCNKKKLASRHVNDAVNRLYMWLMVKNKQVIFSEARVMGLGPRFMSVYISRLAMERRINYDDVDGLNAEWFESTSTLVLSLSSTNSGNSSSKRFNRRGNPGKSKALGEVALVVNPCNLKSKEDGSAGDRSVGDIEPTVLPLTVRILSSIPVALHAVGGEDGGPLDVGVRLYVSSYFGGL